MLLKNENRVLPLSKQVKRIALIGQDAAQARLGGYSGPGVDKVSILDGLKNRLGDRAIIRYEEGCKRINPEYLTVPTYYLSTLDGLPGLEGRYFNNISYEGVPDLKRIDKRIQFSPGCRLVFCRMEREIKISRLRNISARAGGK